MTFTAVNAVARATEGAAIEFWSSVGAHPFQRALMESLAADGIPCREHCAVSQEDYRTARGLHGRLDLRLRTYAQYPVRIARRFRRVPLGHRAVISSNTFYAPWLAMRAGRGRPFIVHWVLDLYPDALIAARKLRAGSGLVSLMRRVMRDTFDRAAANVFLGRRLLAHAEETFGPIPRAHVIPVGADGRPFANCVPQPRTRDECRILYCGNFGHMHEVETVVAVLHEGLPANIELEFRGNGAGMASLDRGRQQWATTGVRLGPNLPDQEWVAAMMDADVALVTMREGAQGVVFPSKAYSALVAGQAILAVCPPDSDLADLVNAHDAGWIVAPGNSRGLAEMLRRMAEHPDERLAKRRNAWSAGHAYYDQAVIAKAWAQLLQPPEGKQ